MEELIARRAPICFEPTDTCYGGNYAAYYAGVTVNIAHDKNYEIFCRYRPTLVWKKVGPMRWEHCPRHKRLRYLDSGVYGVGPRDGLLWTNDVTVDWQDGTYIEEVFCTDTIEGKYLRFDYCRIFTTKADPDWKTQEFIQTREEYHESSKKRWNRH